jgi:hypothetical protein
MISIPYAVSVSQWRHPLGKLIAGFLFLSFAVSFPSAWALDQSNASGSLFCSQTASLMYQSCISETNDGFFKAQAICINISDADERDACQADAISARREAFRLCGAQLSGRRVACTLLGEDRYDPVFDPTQFVEDFVHPDVSNPYFPLGIGHTWKYASANETSTIEVQNATKLIAGVRCIVLVDRVVANSGSIEDTEDWFALAKNGDVYYCGEEVKDYEIFDGDDPKRPELVKIDGSFKWGRDGDKGGIFFRAQPRKGDVYREEFSLGNAEDVTEVLSTTYAFGKDPRLDQFVPPKVANIFCNSNCIVTKNYALLEPGAFAYKYYALGIGVILEIMPQTGEVNQLVDCNFDQRCASLSAR